MRIKVLFFVFLTAIVTSCSKDDIGGGGTKNYYVLEGVYNYNPNLPAQYQNTGFPNLTEVALMMPSGSFSRSMSLTTPHTTAEREYPAGMTISAEAESVLTYTTITIKIYRDGKLWKEQSVAGNNSYAFVKITATI